MQKYLSIIFFMFLLSCGKSDKDVLINAMNRNANSLNYTVVVNKKPFFKNDTIASTYDVYLEKNKNDSLYGYNFKIDYSNTTVYNIDNTLYIVDLKNRLFKKKYKKIQQLSELIIPNNHLREEDIVNTKSTKIKKKDENFIVTKKYIDRDEFKNIVEVYNILSKSNQIQSISSSIDFQNSNQYFKYEFGTIDKDPSNVDILKEVKNIINSYTLEEIDTLKIARIENTKLPSMTGKLLSDRKIIPLNSFQSKILIIDYWYMACYPCIKTIPILNNISKLYSNEEVQVIGIDVFDNQESKLNALEKFAVYHNIKYPIFLTDQDPLSIREYPTLLIYNEDRNLIHSIVGYNENKEKEINDIIEIQLNKYNDDNK